MRVDPSKIVPTSEDTPERWIAFHKALKSWFGKQSANAYFLRFWGQRAGAGTSADTHSLRDYMDTQGVDLTTDWKGSLSDFSWGISDWFSDGAKTIRFVIVGTLVVGVGLVAFYFIHSTLQNKSVGQMIMDAPVSPVGKYKALKGSKTVKFLGA